MIKLSRKYRILYWLVGVLILFCILGNRSKDRFIYQSLPEELIQAEEFSPQEDGTGILTEGKELSLKKGTYTLEATVGSAHSEDKLIVCAKDALSENNAIGVELALVPAYTQSGKVQVSFTVDRDYDHVEVWLTGQKEAFAQSRLYEYSLVSQGLIYRDTLFLAVLWVAFLLAVRVLFIRSAGSGESIEVQWTDRLKKSVFFAVVTVLVSLPLFTDFLADSHDLGFHLNRIEGIYEALQSGQFPAGINAVFNGGSGYPTEIMYPGLLLYFPALLRMCGVSLLLSYKVYCVVLNLLTVILSYTAFGKVTNSHRVGALAAILYTFSLYRIDNLLCRGAIGEWTAMTFLPLVIWGMWEVFYHEKKYWPVLTLGLTFVFQSHLISTLLCLMFCVGFGLLGIRKLKEVSRLGALAAAAAGTVLLNAFAIVPIFTFLKTGMSIAGQERMIGDYAVYLPQIFSTFIYNGHFAKGLGETQCEMPITIGGIFLLGILLFGYAAYYKKILSEADRKRGMVFLTGGLFAVFLSSDLFPWNLLQFIPKVGRLFGMIQFPFRFLMFAVLCLSVVTALAVNACLKQKFSLTGALVLAVCFVTASVHFDGYLEQNETLMSDKFETCIAGKLGQDYINFDYYDKNTDWQAVADMDKRVLVNDDGLRISNLKKEGVSITLDYENAGLETVFLDLPLYYIEGYRAEELSSGESLPVQRGERSRVRVFLPKSLNGSVQIRYERTVVFRIFDWISALTAVGGAAVFLMRNRQHGEKLRKKQEDRNGTEIVSGEIL